MKTTVHKRMLETAKIGSTTLLAATRLDNAISLTFATPIEPSELTLAGTAKPTSSIKVHGLPILTYAGRFPEQIALTLGETTTRITPAPAETDLFKGKNVILGTRNGETAEITADWLKFHAETQNANAAVIIDRAEPNTDDFAAQLAKAAKNSGIETILILSCDAPLGKAGMPAEADPFCAPKAPGKDRMTIPNPDPWRAPLGMPLIFDVVRSRFLSSARAVANIDVCDLLKRSDGPSVFDLAAQTETGLIPFAGQMCYPWRVKPKSAIHFGDHICTPFDHENRFNRWCIAPAKSLSTTVWLTTKVAGTAYDPAPPPLFYRHMAIRHPSDKVSNIVAKSSLTESQTLLKQSKKYWGHKPSRIPKIKTEKPGKNSTGSTIVTTMKNEGPFILEWIAYHRAIGFDNILVYTNDCTDGTDTMLKMLQDKGICQHRENPFKSTNLRPQHAALRAAEDEPVIQNADWVTCIDVDEFVNIKVGDGTLTALFNAMPDANLISMTWRLFGNANTHEFHDGFITQQFTQCAPELCRKPHQAWGFKTLFKHNGIFKKLGVHRPKGLNPQFWEDIHWTNGSGQKMPRDMYRNGWRSTTKTYGYDLVQLNHYAVRSAESFLVKRDRGRVNHVDRDQGMSYWFRMNNNAEAEISIHNRLPLLQAEWDRLMADPEIATAHAYSVAKHREKIDALKATENYTKFYGELTGARLEKLSTMHSHFGANVFLSGPDVIPDDILAKNAGDDFTFTVPKTETTH